MTTGNRQHGKIPNTCKKKLQRKHYLPHLKSTLAFKKVMIKFQLFPSCVRPSDVKKQRTDRPHCSACGFQGVGTNC